PGIAKGKHNHADQHNRHDRSHDDRAGASVGLLDHSIQPRRALEMRAGADHRTPGLDRACTGENMVSRASSPLGPGQRSSKSRRVSPQTGRNMRESRSQASFSPQKTMHPGEMMPQHRWLVEGVWTREGSVFKQLAIGAVLAAAITTSGGSAWAQT